MMLEQRVDTQQDYQSFLQSKRVLNAPSGITPAHDYSYILASFQSQLVMWALRKGRAALFTDTGTGKTRMALAWANEIPGKVLILAPLAVAQQTVQESIRIGVPCNYARSQQEVHDKITVTNYEMLHAFDSSAFTGVVLDESSIIKAEDGKTRQRLIDAFRDTAYRLCCTATPAPNDVAEFANHAEFLGICTREEMLSMFFVHDESGWRLKGHAVEPFYQWMASWAMMMKMPSDIGFSDDGYVLPELDIQPVWVDGDEQEIAHGQGKLLLTGLEGVQGRAVARRATVSQKVGQAAGILNSSNEQWIVWCGLNDEGRKLAKMVPDATLVEGSQTIEEKLRATQRFLDGEIRVLISKVKISGFGLNLQACHNVLFLGLNDSWEMYYQAIRRCWRFGQEKPVNVRIVLADAERPIYENVLRKDAQAETTQREMMRAMASYEREELFHMERHQNNYHPEQRTGQDWTMLLGDNVEHLSEIDPGSVDLAVFSPPFLSLYVYSDSERDMGNSRTVEEFYEHFGFFLQGLARVMRPGRIVCCHVAQVPTTLVNDGVIGLRDFRGKTIEAFENHAFVYHGEVVIDKDPQAQAIRTKAKGLLFRQLKRDASWLRPALADYILVFRAPGENRVPIQPDLTNDEWIQWARPIWYGIRESDTLHVAEARADQDERHIAPLQLGTIGRCVRLWSNRGEVVLDPYSGIGSTGYVALQHSRRYLGIELKPTYFDASCRNLNMAEEKKQQMMLPM